MDVAEYDGELINYKNPSMEPIFLNQFLGGVGLGWTAPTLPRLQSNNSDFQINPDQAAWLGSINEMGRIIGPVVAPLLLDNIGRKNTSILLSLIYALVWIPTIFIRDIYVLLATRILFGIGSGISDVALSIYVAEVCSPEYRGVGGSAIMTAFFIGLNFEFFAATYLSYTNCALLNAAWAICAIASQYFAVETTYFLTLKGRHEKARKNLAWVLADAADVDDELKKIRKNVEDEKRKQSSIKLLFSSRTNLRAMFVAVGFYFLFSCIGRDAVTPFAASIFSPTENITAEKFTIVFGLVEFVAAIVSIFVTEKVNRRPMIMYSCCAIILCNICTAILLNQRGHHHQQIAHYPWWLFASIALYGFVGSFIVPAIYMMNGEILPLSVRAIGSSMAIAASSAGSFLAAILFWPVTERYGMGVNFILYAGMSSALAVFVWLTVPETRGKALYEMYKKPTKIEINVIDFAGIVPTESPSSITLATHSAP